MTRRSAGIWMVALVVMVGCVEEKVPAGSTRGKLKTTVTQKPAAAPVEEKPDGVARIPTPANTDGHAELDAITADEPCGNRMHDLAGTMLMYYAIHKTLPPTLDELKPLADIDQALDFTCPLSGHAYAYEPAGLSQPAQEGRLVLFDDQPVHKGGRWGIIASPAKGKKPPTATAVFMKEETFRKYVVPLP